MAEGFGKAAGTFDETYQLTREVTKLRAKATKSVIVLPVTADKYTLAHENQHATDFENSQFALKLANDFKFLFQANYLTEDEKADFESSVIEIRGYSRQEIELRKDSLLNLAMFD